MEFGRVNVMDCMFPEQESKDHRRSHPRNGRTGEAGERTLGRGHWVEDQNLDIEGQGCQLNNTVLGPGMRIVQVCNDLGEVEAYEGRKTGARQNLAGPSAP